MIILIQMESFGTMQMDSKWFIKSFGKDMNLFNKITIVLQVIFILFKVA